jgi:biotin carboxylase
MSVQMAFKTVFGKRNGLGLMNTDVLVQEFLQGKEYVVDKMSKDGVHKIIAIWEYDKRPVNGASFVYFGMRLMSSDTPKSQELIKYADGVLNALGIMQGPSHMEVMYCADGPCLVEVGARCHGGEGSWLPIVQECIGYTIVSTMLDVYTNGPLFDKIDANNFTMCKAGREVDMVNREPGIIRATPGDAKIRALKSFRSINWEVKIGDFAPVTIDCFTRPGSVQLVNESEEQAEQDLENIHKIEEEGLFDYSVICPNPPVIGSVVVVDPFSTGANLAAAVLKWGYKLIIIFSEMETSQKAVLSKSAHMPSTLLIQHDSRAHDQDRAINDTVDKLRKQSSPVLAILAGAQTGVQLAEYLAARFKTRNNGQQLIPVRHDKIKMQERIAAAGVAALKQKVCSSEKEVTDFLHTLPVESHFKCVVKPLQSTATDGVHLLHSNSREGNIEKATQAFQSMNGKPNAFGKVNEGILVQEYLEGSEFIVDAVLRDGIYKVTAIWEYQRRENDSSSCLYHGMRLRSADKPEIKTVIDYSAAVVNALGYRNGPVHMEIILTPSGPKLLEIGWRCHGGLGTWLPIAQECIGYTQIEATLNCFLRPELFDTLPSVPTVSSHGMEVFLFSNQAGTVKSIPALDTIRELRSVR